MSGSTQPEAVVAQRPAALQRKQSVIGNPTTGHTLSTTVWREVVVVIVALLISLAST